MKKYKNAIALIIIYSFYFIIVEVADLPTRCFIKNITGLPCPGCGLTRSYEAFFHGDIAGALYYHPMFWIVPIIVILIILNVMSKNKGLQKIFNVIYVTILVALIILYIIRMIMYFPDEQPMNYNNKGLYPRIIEIMII